MIYHLEPIGDWSTVADEDRFSGFLDGDRRALHNPKWRGNVRDAFRNTSHQYNFFFLQDVKDRRSTYTAKSLFEVSDYLLDYTFDMSVPDSINVVFTNNFGTDRVAMTPWIIAHRTSHTIHEHLDDGKGVEYVQILHDMCIHIKNINNCHHRLNKDLRQVLKFRSAKKQLTRYGELFHEIFAQYLIQGSVTFIKLPNTVPDADVINSITRKYAPKINASIKRLLDQSVGNIYIL
jgi:hypothetical protein